MTMDLKAWRQELGISQQKLADLCTEFRGSKVYAHQIGAWERTGRISKTSLRMLEALRARLSTPQVYQTDSGRMAGKVQAPEAKPNG